MTVIDASVYVALINVHERDYAACWAWFQREQARQHSISAPVILLSEVAAALSRGMGDPVLAHRVVQHLLHTRLVELVPVSLALAQQAATIAADHRIRGSDAIYVALAEHLGADLVTLDQQQLERGSAVITARRP
jgi:predicted nucleic acid-binding protein